MSFEHVDTPKQKELKIISMDLSKSWDKESQRDIIIQKLKRLKIYKPNLLFRGLDGDKINVIKEHGTDDPDVDMVFCSTEGELADEYGMKESALDFASEYHVPAVAVYDGNKMIEQIEEGGGGYEYSPKSGFNFKDALIAVLMLK